MENKKDYREEVESYTDGDGSESSSGSESTNSSGGSQSSESESSSGSSERERKRRHVKRKSSKQKKERRSRRSDAEGEEELEYDDYEKRKRRKLSRHRHEDPERHNEDHVIRGEEHKHRSSSRKHKHHHRKHRHKHRRHKRHRDHSEEKRGGGEKGEGRRGRDGGDDRRYKDRGEYEAPDRDRDRRPDRDGERRDRKEDKRREKYESRHVRSKWEEEEEEEEEEDMQWDASRRIKAEPGVEEEAATRRPLRVDQAQRHRDTRRPKEERELQEGDGNQASENQRSAWGLQNPNEGSAQSGGPTGDEEEEERQKPNLGLTGKLAEDANTYNGVVIKYSQPPEARKPKRRWRWYIFKGDEDLPYLPLHRQSAYLIGRDRKVADIPTDHPSCSKQHAVLQYRLVGYQRDDGTKGRTVKPYILDLESANGTFVNNRKIDGRRFVELLEKDVVKFGYSSREYILLHEGSKGDDDSMPDTGVDLSPVSLLRSKV